MAQDEHKIAAARSILQQAVSPASVQPDGYLTRPRTWGVYKVPSTRGSSSTRSYRIGNHPVRGKELEREFGSVEQLAIFTSRGLAEELARLLNAARSK